MVIKVCDEDIYRFSKLYLMISCIIQMRLVLKINFKNSGPIDKLHRKKHTQVWYIITFSFNNIYNIASSFIFLWTDWFDPKMIYLTAYVKLSSILQFIVLWLNTSALFAFSAIKKVCKSPCTISKSYICIFCFTTSGSLWLIGIKKFRCKLHRDSK